MAYLGNDLKVAYPTYVNIDDISGSFNGSTTSFALLVRGAAPVPLPLNSQQCLISVAGVLQRPDDTGAEGFRLSGGNIVFSSAPATGADFFGVILAGADYVNAGATYPDGSAAVPSITFDQDTDTGFYRSGSGVVSFSSNSVQTAILATTSLTAPSFIPTSSTVPSNGVYLPSANNVAISTNSQGRLFVNSSGNVGIGKTPDVTGSPIVGGLQLVGGANLFSWGSFGAAYLTANAFYNGTNWIYQANNASSVYIAADGTHVWLRASGGTAGNTATLLESARIDSSGRLLVGTSTARTKFYAGNATFTPAFQVERAASTNDRGTSFVYNSNDAECPTVILGKSRGTAVNGFTAVQNGDLIGRLSFQGADGTNLVEGATVDAFVDGAPGSNDLPTALRFSTTADGASSPTERMRITQEGNVMVGKTTNAGIVGSTTGVDFGSVGYAIITRSGEPSLFINRLASDGDLIRFFQDSNQEGSISVSGTTVSYNGAHLSRWSQLPGGTTREEILRGTVLSNIDEMCAWGEEENEQLNRMKVSDVEGDPNVAGVFQAWDDDDDTYTDDFYCAMTGDFIIRIAEGVTVQRGDLLMSAGDGTAKPQDDDIIRSKTVAKVTSTHVTCTYADGSYCVPCVLMAC